MKAINKSLTLSSFPDWMISFLLPIYCTGLGFSPAQTTRMFALHSLFLLLGKLISGRLCDRVGRRVVFLAGLVLMSGAYLLLAFAQGAALLYSSQVLDGAASALLAVSAYAMLADRSGENMAVDRGRHRRPPIGARCTAFFSTSCCSPGWALGRAGRPSSCCAQC